MPERLGCLHNRKSDFDKDRVVGYGKGHASYKHGLFPTYTYSKLPNNATHKHTHFKYSKESVANSVIVNSKTIKKNIFVYLNDNKI